MYGETENHLVKEKMSLPSLNNIKEIVEKSVLLDTIISNKDSKNKMDNTAFMHSFYTIYNGELLKLYVEEALSNNEKTVFTRAYELKDIQKIADIPDGVLAKNGSLTDEISAKYSISDLYALVKAYDKDFHAGKPVNPLLLNKDGTPKKFYHGTNSAFTVFDLLKSGKNYGDLSKGMFFFTNKKNAYPNSATDYAREAVKRNGGAENVMAVYLNIKKPLVLNSKGYYSTNEYYDRNKDAIYDKYFDGDYDAIIVENSDKNSDDAILAVVDNPTQIKSATDNIGTFDGSNPDIRFSQEIDKPKRKTALESARARANAAERQLSFVKKQNETIAIIDKINEQKSNLFENATETPKFKFYGILGRFGRILRGGNISANTAKSVMQDLRTWYNESPAFMDADGKKNAYYNQDIAAAKRRAKRRTVASASA